MTIARRTRKVSFTEGYPVVNIGGEKRIVREIVTKGSDNPKTDKNSGADFFPLGITLSPHKTAGVGNVCAHAGVCAATCLDVQGKGAATGNMHTMIHGIRIARTLVWHHEREWFLETLHSDIERYKLLKHKLGQKLCVRPNMLSDIAWEKWGVPQAHPDVQFYDYTKNPRRVGQVCDNYWVTFSRDSAKDDATCIRLLSEGKNVAMAFDDGYTTGGRNLHGAGPIKMPESWNGFPVYNGDLSDRRWEDPRGHVVGLVLKAHSQESRQHALSTGFAI